MRISIGKLNTIEGQKEAILILICMLYFILFAFILSCQSVVLIHSDHYSRWYPTYNLVHDHRSIYDPKNGQEVVALNPIPVNSIEGSFFYPAPLLIFTLPLVFFSYPIAHFIWLVVIQLFFLLGIYIIAKLVSWPKSANHLAFLMLLSIFFIPNIQHTIWGQFNTICVISLALTYWALVKRKYAQAGIWATGLTFKPQMMILTLVFLLIWAVSNRKRWPFLLGFTLTGLGLWAFAEILEPGWVFNFLKGVQAYSAYLHPPMALELIGIYPKWVYAVIIALTLMVFVIHGKDKLGSPGMIGSLALSAAVWWLVVPILGMMHIVALPAILILLFSSLSQHHPKIARFGVFGFLLLYGLGLIGFIYGLSDPSFYGTHLQLSELAYKVAAPILIIGLTIYLLAKSKNESSTLNAELLPER